MNPAQFISKYSQCVRGVGPLELQRTGLGDGEWAVYIPRAPCPALAATFIALSPSVTRLVLAARVPN